MLLHLASMEIDQDTVLDLNDLMDNNENVTDANSLYTMLVVEIARWSLENAASFDAAYGQYVEDDNGNELWIHGDSQSNPDWIKEVAQLVWYVNNELPSWHDSDVVFAYVEGSGWRYFDFDNMSEWKYHYSQEYDGDPEEFAINWMSDVGDESLPDHLEPYFDFEEYGKALLNNYYEYEWNDRTFLFYQH